MNEMGPVSITTSPIRLLHSTGRFGFELTEHTTRRGGLCVYVIDARSSDAIMAGGQRLLSAVFFTMLSLFTFTQTQLKICATGVFPRCINVYVHGVYVCMCIAL